LSLSNLAASTALGTALIVMLSAWKTVIIVHKLATRVLYIYTVSQKKKTSPMFLAITRESIDGFL